MRNASSWSGAYVRDLDTGSGLFSWRYKTPRILASNTKLFTLGATLSRRGPDGRIVTRAAIANPLKPSGVIRGNLYLIGGGDPTLGGKGFVRSNYGRGGATVEALADRLKKAGVRVIKGHVVGDESRFDTRRSGPAEGYRASGEVGGPVSALAFNHGLDDRRHFQHHPAAFAAGKLAIALRRRGIKVSKSGRGGKAPRGADELARVRSFSMAKVARLTARPSDNYFAETLAKGLGSGSTRSGARAVVRFAARRGAAIHLADGSGLSRSDQASPRAIVRYLYRERHGAREGRALYDALPVAGENGTLHDRMRSGWAHNRCHAKTGTLIGVSALSGYCKTRGGHTLVFSILMNGMSDIYYAHDLQDRMAEAIAKYTGDG